VEVLSSPNIRSLSDTLSRRAGSFSSCFSPEAAVARNLCGFLRLPVEAVARHLLAPASLLLPMAFPKSQLRGSKVPVMRVQRHRERKNILRISNCAATENSTCSCCVTPPSLGVLRGIWGVSRFDRGSEGPPWVRWEAHQPGSSGRRVGQGSLWGSAPSAAMKGI
jgi:hypothetical protein